MEVMLVIWKSVFKYRKKDNIIAIELIKVKMFLITMTSPVLTSLGLLVQQPFRDEDLPNLKEQQTDKAWEQVNSYLSDFLL